jgi:hypothetical protein
MTTLNPAPVRRLNIGRVLTRTFTVFGDTRGGVFVAALVLWALPLALVNQATAMPAYVWLDAMVNHLGWTRSMDTMQRMEVLQFFRVTFNSLKDAVPFALFKGVAISMVLRALDGERPRLVEDLLRGMNLWPVLLVVAVARDFVLVIGFVALVVPGVIIAVWAVALIPTLAAERRGPFQALARALALSRGSRWRVLLVLTIYAAAVVAYGLATTRGLRALHGALHEWPSWFWTAIGWLRVLPLAVVGTTGAAVLYHELRRAKEGVREVAAAFD